MHWAWLGSSLHTIWRTGLRSAFRPYSITESENRIKYRIFLVSDPTEYDSIRVDTVISCKSIRVYLLLQRSEAPSKTLDLNFTNLSLVLIYKCLKTTAFGSLRLLWKSLSLHHNLHLSISHSAPKLSLRKSWRRETRSLSSLTLSRLALSSNNSASSAPGSPISATGSPCRLSPRW